MNHKINLLEPSEIHYLSVAESNPLIKLAGLGVLALGIAGAGLFFLNLKNTAAKYDGMAIRWGQIQEEVAEARELSQRKHRLDLGTQTLKGWSTSRVSWAEVLTYLVDQAPSDLEDLQFTRLQWNEEMTGLRNQAPATEKADFHPLQRTLELNLRGVLRSSRPERLLTRFQKSLLTGPAPVQIEAVTLDNYIQLKDEAGDLTDRTTFAFTIRLAPREVLP